MTQEEYKDEVRRIRPKLLSVARRYVGNDDAEDTVQDVLLRLWQMLDQLRQPIDALATVLVRNHCISLLRKQHRAVVQPAAVSDTSPVSVSDGSPVSVSDGSPVGSTATDRLMAIIETLPTMQQTVLHLRHIDGMAMRDIAAITGSSEVAVRKALSRARQTIRQKYQKHDDR